MAADHDRVSADEAREILARFARGREKGHPADVWGPLDRLEALARTVIAREAEVAELRAERDRLQRACDEGLPRELLLCPACGQMHIDGANGVEFATRPHHTHLCQHCGHVWDNGRWSFGADVPAPVRYRRVSLYGHVSLGVCRIEDVEVAGVKMIRATTLCAAIPRVAEFPGTSVYVLHVLSAEEALAEAAEAMDAAQKAAENRAEQARRDAERAAQDAREQEARRVARAHALVTVTVVGEHVVLLPTVDGVRRHDLLRRDDPEVSQGLRAAVSNLYNAHVLYDVDNHCSGLEVVREADRVDALVAMLHALGFGEVVRLPDQPARTEDADVPF